MIKLKKILFTLCFFICVSTFSQILSSTLDKKTLALGEVNSLVVKIDQLNNQKVNAASKNELLPFHFEEIKDSFSAQPNSY